MPVLNTKSQQRYTAVLLNNTSSITLAKEPHPILILIVYYQRMALHEVCALYNSSGRW